MDSFFPRIIRQAKPTSLPSNRTLKGPASSSDHFRFDSLTLSLEPPSIYFSLEKNNKGKSFARWTSPIWQAVLGGPRRQERGIEHNSALLLINSIGIDGI
jgi:hypothetical protein